jgi:hypothetical protein
MDLDCSAIVARRIENACHNAKVER